MNSDRGAWQRPLEFAREERWARHAKLFRTEPTDPAHTDQPALDVSPEDALMELIVSPNNLQRAWRQVKGNRGAPGPDGMTIAEFEDWAHENWALVRQQLLEGTYQPQPVRRKTIPKPGGKGERLLGIPNVLDRLIQQAIVQVLTPIFDPGFSDSSFGFRPNRSAHGAAKQVQRIIRQRHAYCIDVDLSKFFDRVPTRRFDEPREPQGSRSTFAAIDRPLPASGRDGRRRIATDGRGRATRRSAFTLVK